MLGMGLKTQCSFFTGVLEMHRYIRFGQETASPFRPLDQ